MFDAMLFQLVKLAQHDIISTIILMFPLQGISSLKKSMKEFLFNAYKI